MVNKRKNKYNKKVQYKKINKKIKWMFTSIPKLNNNNKK
jgi:hypothetical protein